MSEAEERIELSDTPRDVLVKMAQGNPGALMVMLKFIESDPRMGLLDLLRMDDMGMRGPAVWIGYKDHCGEDFEKFRECVRTRDLAMLAKIRSQGYAASRYHRMSPETARQLEDEDRRFGNTP